ncbi:MAG: PIN domain-containing protein [Actinobacteria bacterium]|nr:PIN domain-containing protein [Actinomycetota bacterium]
MIIVDTGVLHAGTDRDDLDHQQCAAILDEHAGHLFVPIPVIIETSWMIETRLGADAEAGFLRSTTNGELGRIDLEDIDWVRVIELIDTYADLELGVVDAS